MTTPLILSIIFSIDISLLPENYKHFIIRKRSHNSDCKPKYNEVILKSKNKFKVFVDENLGIAPRKLVGHFQVRLIIFKA